MTSMLVAAVQAAPVFLDREASVDKACALIGEAAARGARLIGFPEGFVPGHPGWVELLAFDDQSMGLGKRLFLESLEVPGPDVDRIATACAAGSIAAVVGACERIPGSTGTLFNTQFFVDEQGTYRGKHQKLVPTVGERLFHGPGTTGSQCSFEAGVGTVSALICGENSNPLAQYAALRDYPVVHVASWPQHFSESVPMAPVIPLVSSALAYSMKAYVINAVSTISEEMLRDYGDVPQAAFLREAGSRGRASIVGPTGQALAEATDDSEQIVYAEVDPDSLIVPKFVHDYAGHYNRPELFAHLFAGPA